MPSAKATATWIAAILGLLAIPFAGSRPALASETLGVPLDCEPGRTCFLQQYADMKAGPGVSDPFCGRQTYEGHRGTDVRIPSMIDMTANVPVLALADGTVSRIRDGDVDKPVLDKALWPQYRGRHCGNGVIIEHRGGLETQYCHMRKGSLRVRPGDAVTKGEPIGAVGTSGMAAFPHLHITVRSNGRAVDPFTGKALGEGCLRPGETAHPLWSKDALDFFARAHVSIMALGLSGTPPVYARLMLDGPPGKPRGGDRSLVAWGWFLNLRKDDRLHFKVTDPAGALFLDETAKPLSRSKAAYMGYVRKAVPPVPGTWHLGVEVVRGGEAVESRTTSVDVGAPLVSDYRQ